MNFLMWFVYTWSSFFFNPRCHAIKNIAYSIVCFIQFSFKYGTTKRKIKRLEMKLPCYSYCVSCTIDTTFYLTTEFHLPHIYPNIKEYVHELFYRRKTEVFISPRHVFVLCGVIITILLHVFYS